MLIVIARVTEVLTPLASVAVTVNVYVPLPVGVPLIFPVVGSIVSPAGSAPSVIANVIGVFPPEIYFLSKMPSLIDYKSVLIICFFSVLITFFASLYPAISASKLNPIKGLKYD